MSLGSQPLVTFDGTRPSPELEAMILSLVVDTDVNTSDSCVIEFADTERHVLDALGADYLLPVTVTTSPVEGEDDCVIFDGEIYGMDFEFDELGAFSKITAYDRSYRLRQQRITTTYNDVSDTDLVNTIASQVDLRTGDVKNTSTLHPHIGQFNETYWEFLRRRADANDCELVVEGEKLHFRPSADADGGPNPGDFGTTDPLQLIAGSNLLQFSVRTTAAQQVANVDVRGWDPVQKKELVATAEANTRATLLDQDGREVAAEQGELRTLTMLPGVADQAECDAVAEAMGEFVASTFGYAEGVAIGDPRLQAGTPVSVGQTGRFDGKYVLSSARHELGPAGYFTRFTVSGAHDRSLYGLTDHGSGEVAALHGVYPAIVTNVQDADETGRVKLRFPWLADDYESAWSRVMQIGAGPERGFLWLPEVDDEVLVAFIDGDATRPVVVGGLFNGVDKPPFEGYADPGDGSIDTRGIKTRKGHVLQFEDADGAERIHIHTAEESISILLDQANKKLVVQADSDVEVNAQGNVAVTAQRDIKIEAGGKAEISGSAGLKLESSGQVEIKGAIVKLN